MATFKVTDPNSGRTVTLTSQDNTPPTEQELEDVFSSVQSQFESSERERTLEGVDPGQILYRQKTSDGTSFSEEEVRRAGERQIEQGEEEFTEATAPKDIFKAVGAEITPEMEQAHPYWSAAAKTAQEGIAIPTMHFLNQALLNAPRSLLAKKGITIPESETLPGKILAGGAGVIGGLQPGRLAFKGTQAATQLGGNLLQKAALGGASGAAAGGTIGFLRSPEDFTDVESRTKQAKVGVAVGAVAGTLVGVGEQLKAITSAEGKIKLAETVRGTVNAKAKLAADQLDEIGVTVRDSVRDSIAKVRSTPKITNVEKAIEKTVKSDLKNLKPEQLDLAIKNAKIINAYDDISSNIEKGKALSNLATRFGDLELEKVANSFLDEKLIKTINTFRRIEKTVKIIKKAAPIAIGVAAGAGGGGGAILKSLLPGN